MNKNEKSYLTKVIGKPVYAENGYYLGRIKKVHIGNKKTYIYGWVIELEKELAKILKKDSIFIKHNSIKIITDIMVVRKEVLEKITDNYSSKINSPHMLLTESLGKSVHSQDGAIIGIIKDVHLKENRIYGWLIKLEYNFRGLMDKDIILIKQGAVEHIADIMIINNEVLEIIKGFGKEKFMENSLEELRDKPRPALKMPQIINELYEQEPKKTLSEAKLQILDSLENIRSIKHD